MGGEGEAHPRASLVKSNYRQDGAASNEHVSAPVSYLHSESDPILGPAFTARHTPENDLPWGGR